MRVGRDKEEYNEETKQKKNRSPTTVPSSHEKRLLEWLPFGNHFARRATPHPTKRLFTTYPHVRRQPSHRLFLIFLRFFFFFHRVQRSSLFYELTVCVCVCRKVKGILCYSFLHVDWSSSHLTIIFMLLSSFWEENISSIGGMSVTLE